MRGKLAPILAAGCLAFTACAESATGPVEQFDPAFAGGPGGQGITPGMRPFTPSGEKQRKVDLTRGFTYAIHPDDKQILAQTFTPRRDQSLGYLQLPVGCAAGVLLRVRIREGIDGTILSEFNVIDLPQVVDGEFELLQVYDPAVSSGIPLTSGVTYAFELAAVPTTGPETTCGIAPGPAGNSYDVGKGWFRDPINGPNFIPLPNGNPTDDEDLPFITLVR